MVPSLFADHADAGVLRGIRGAGGERREGTGRINCYLHGFGQLKPGGEGRSHGAMPRRSTGNDLIATGVPDADEQGPPHWIAIGSHDGKPGVATILLYRYGNGWSGWPWCVFTRDNDGLVLWGDYCGSSKLLSIGKMYYLPHPYILPWVLPTSACRGKHGGARVLKVCG
jgi:hypothetical protein